MYECVFWSAVHSAVVPNRLWTFRRAHCCLMLLRGTKYRQQTWYSATLFAGDYVLKTVFVLTVSSLSRFWLSWYISVCHSFLTVFNLVMQYCVLKQLCVCKLHIVNSNFKKISSSCQHSNCFFLVFVLLLLWIAVIITSVSALALQGRDVCWLCQYCNDSLWVYAQWDRRTEGWTIDWCFMLTNW